MPHADAPAPEGMRRSTRNPRRRQRDSDSFPGNGNGSRKRSKLNNSSFSQTQSPRTSAGVSASFGSANGHAFGAAAAAEAEAGFGAAAAAAAAAAAGRAGAGAGAGARKGTSPAPSIPALAETTAELTLRGGGGGGGKKGTGKRHTKGDGSTLLTQNEHYAIRHLPSTPDILRQSASDYRASILTSPPLALAVTHERAYIWDYTSPIAVTHPRTFSVSQPSKPSDPLPIAALVPNAATKSIGLLIVSPTTARVTYWENMDTAESLSLFQHRNAGIEGSIGSLFGGETVVDITSADHAGFLVVLSSGRVAQLTLSDSQGKPKISAHFLRSHDASSSAGIFGSLKSTLGLGAWKRDVVAVKTRPLGARRMVQAISATETGAIQVWNLAWSGQNSFHGTFDFRELLQTELVRVERSGMPPRMKDVKVLDMAIMPTLDNALATTQSINGKDDPLLNLMLLIKSTDMPSDTPKYSLANIVLDGDEAHLEHLDTVRNGPVPYDERRPRLLIPKSGHFAYIVSEQQITISSLSTRRTPDSPQASLALETHEVSQPFQDSIHLRSDKHLVIEACSEEDTLDARASTTCAIFIKGYGLVRITANDATSSERSKPSIKSKIEQAMFYGTLPDNIFDFSRQLSDKYTQGEVEHAARDISTDLLTSSSPFIPPPIASMEVHIASRVKAARALINYLQRNYGPVSQSTAWALMTDAEKLEAAAATWAAYSARSSTHKPTEADDSPYPSTLPFCIKALRKSADDFDPELDQIDLLRDWFAYHTDQMTHLIRTVLFTIWNTHKANKLDGFLYSLIEANDVIFAVYEAVFAFRSDNAELYGLDPTILSEGILEESFADRAEPWTSTYEVIKSFNAYLDLSRDFCFNLGESNAGHDTTTVDYLGQCAVQSVKLVQILCLCYRERIAYLAVNGGERGPDLAAGTAESFNKSRTHHLAGLSKIGQAGAGIQVAEKYRDMDTLVALVVEDYHFQHGLLNETLKPQDRVHLEDTLNTLNANVDRYFRDFGDAWANAYFARHLQSKKSYGLLREAADYQAPLTRYLRAEKSRGRLSWINDVLREKDFAAAGRALASLARDMENKIWNKKIETSLAKLASLAVREEMGSQQANGSITQQIQGEEDDLTLVRIQSDIKAHFEPIYRDGVDLDASVQLVAEAFGPEELKLAMPALNQVLEVGFEDILKDKVVDPDELIDVLTLMDPRAGGNAGVNTVAGREFLLALEVLKAAKPRMGEAWFQTYHKLIWKRCWLHDDWQAISEASKIERGLNQHVLGTAVCTTIALGLKESLFDSSIRPLAPSETFHAGCSPQDISSRFPTEDLIEPILHDNLRQDEKLRAANEQCGLEEWFTEVQKQAKDTLEQENQQLRESEQEETDMARQIRDRLSDEAVTIGHDTVDGLGLDGGRASRNAADGIGPSADVDGEMDMS